MTTNDNDPELTFTVAGTVEGYPLETMLVCTLGELPGQLRWLRARGFLPVAPLPPPLPSPRFTGKDNLAPSKATLEARGLIKKSILPLYDPETGDPLCPLHKRILINGKFGLYCPAKATGDEPHNANGYCALKFEED